MKYLIKETHAPYDPTGARTIKYWYEQYSGNNLRDLMFIVISKVTDNVYDAMEAIADHFEAQESGCSFEDNKTASMTFDLAHGRSCFDIGPASEQPKLVKAVALFYCLNPRADEFKQLINEERTHFELDICSTPQEWLYVLLQKWTGKHPNFNITNVYEFPYSHVIEYKDYNLTGEDRYQVLQVFWVN